MLLAVQFELLPNLTHQAFGGQHFHHRLTSERQIRLLAGHAPENLLNHPAFGAQLTQGGCMHDISIGDAAPMGPEPLLDFADPLLIGRRFRQFDFHISIVRRYGRVYGVKLKNVTLDKLRDALRKAQIVFTERPVPHANPATTALVVQRAGYEMSVTPTVYYDGPVVEIRPSGGPAIRFHTNRDPAELVAAMDTLVQVQRLAGRLQPKWATRQLALLTGRRPGSPVLVYQAGCARLGIIPRPPSFNQIHKHAAVKEYRLGASPKLIARDLAQLHQQNTPRRSWQSVTDDWNCRYGAAFGHELTLSASYIYAWNGMRFLLDGDDLALDVWALVCSAAFPEAIRLLESIQAVLGKAVKDRASNQRPASAAALHAPLPTETPSN